MNKTTPPEKKKIQRESSFELIRILSQIMIVLYHICYIWQSGDYKNEAFFKTVSIPLHIGVILFVLLSGYFTIKPTSKGFIKFMGIFLVYDAFEVSYNLLTANNGITVLKQMLFLSSSHFWFIKTYLFLFLSSPILNMWLKYASHKQRWYMIMVFFFVACWMGTTKGDSSMSTGKNLVNFMFLYLIGNQLSYYKEKWANLKTRNLLLAYIILTSIIVIPHYCFFGTMVSKVIFRLSFPYCSPIILVSSILFFMIIGKIKIQNKWINYVAASSLAIYLIHGSRPFLPTLHSTVTGYIQTFTDSESLLLMVYLLYSILVVAFCVFTDKMFTPVWSIINKTGVKIYNKFGF